MVKANLKTSQTNVSVKAFIASAEHERRWTDVETLRYESQDVGKSIIGYGRCCYRYDSE